MKLLSINDVKYEAAKLHGGCFLNYREYTKYRLKQCEYAYKISGGSIVSLRVIY